MPKAEDWMIKMKNKNNSKRKDIKNEDFAEIGVDKGIRFFICLIVGLVPIIVFLNLQTVSMPVIDSRLNLSTGTFTDFFTYNKLIALLTFTFIILILFLVKLFTTDSVSSKMKPLDIAIWIFVLSLCVTLIVTDYKTFNLWGGFTRNLGAITYFSCALILFTMTNINLNEKWEKMIIISLYPVIIINAIMIVISYYDVNLWDYNVFASLLTAGKEEYVSESARIYGTLNHVNYLSGLGSVLFAIFAGKAVLDDHCSPAQKAQSIIAAVLSATIVFASKSSSGLVTMLLIIIFLLGLVFESRGKKSGYILILILSALSWTTLSLHDASFINEIKEGIGLLIATAVFSSILFIGYLLYKNWSRLNKKRVLITTVALLIICCASLISITPKIVDTINAEMTRIDSERIEERLEKDEFDFPESRFTWGTGRIYIWKETLKIVAEKPLFGYGFDTLAFEFDQTDPAKIAAMEIPDVIVEKPHNSYINMLYGGGSSSLLAFMAIVFIVILKALKALRDNSYENRLIWPILLGILAYLFQALFNDPVQGFESIFWVLLGLCYGLARNKLNNIDKLEN